LFRFRFGDFDVRDKVRLEVFGGGVVVEPFSPPK
jgi:hypothetical protein